MEINPLKTSQRKPLPGTRPVMHSPAPDEPCPDPSGDLVDISNNTKPDEWTFLVYSSITGDIAPSGEEAFHRLESAGSGDGINVVAQRGRTPAPNSGGWSGVRRYYVNNPAPDGTSESLMLQDLGHQDLSNPKNLEDFITWGMNRYPARHYGVILGGHGGGFLGAITDSSRTKMMTLPQIESALTGAIKKTGVKPDLLVFNSCFMSSVETASQLGGVTDFITASEKAEYGPGLPLEKLVSLARQESRQGKTLLPEVGARKLIEATAETPGQVPAAGAVNTKKFQQVTKCLDRLADSLLTSDTSIEVLREVIAGTSPAQPKARREPPFTDLRDLEHLAFALKSSPKITDSKVKSAAKKLYKALSKAVVASTEAGFDQLPQKERQMLQEMGIDADSYRYRYGGVSIFAPVEGLQSFGSLTQNIINGRYQALKLARTNRWPRFVAKLLEENKSGYNPSGKGGKPL